MTEVGTGRMPELPITGERTVPGVPQENYWLGITNPLCEVI